MLGGAGPGGPMFRVNQSQTSAGGIGGGSTELPRRLGGGNGSLDTGQPLAGNPKRQWLEETYHSRKEHSRKTRIYSTRRISTSSQHARKEVGTE